MALSAPVQLQRRRAGLAGLATTAGTLLQAWFEAAFGLEDMKKAFVFVVLLALGASSVALYRTLLVRELRAQVLAQLNNPPSVEFRNEVYLGNWTVSGGTLCGQVDVPGHEGGTEGFQWFSVAKGVFIENENLRRQFDAAGIKRCSRDGKPPGTPWWWMYW
ncbi:hypothetical protein [Acidovorax sp.]|uniref:hypothetical protein n=1 Tax=Acidovorax sp. TaxID=1872122 RepID=UPI00391F428F